MVEITRSAEIRRRNRWLFGLYLLAAIHGLRWYAVNESARSGDLLFGTLMPGLIMTFLVIADTKTVGRPVPQFAGWVVFLFWPIAGPVFVIWARGLAGLGWVALHGLLLWGVMNGTWWLLITWDPFGLF